MSAVYRVGGDDTVCFCVGFKPDLDISFAIDEWNLPVETGLPVFRSQDELDAYIEDTFGRLGTAKYD